MADLQKILRAVLRGAKKSQLSVSSSSMTPEEQKEVVEHGAEVLNDIRKHEEDRLRKILRRHKTTTITMRI